MDGLILNFILRNSLAKLSYRCNDGWMGGWTDGRTDMVGRGLENFVLKPGVSE